MKIIKLFSAAMAVALLNQAAFAHHSTAGIYDESKEVELTGTVKEWKFINPHPTLKIIVSDDKGASQEWDVSYGGSAVTHLKRRGYDATTFKPGEKITVKGFQTLAKDAHGLLMERGTPKRADGTPVVATPAGGGIQGGPPPAQ